MRRHETPRFQIPLSSCSSLIYFVALPAIAVGEVATSNRQNSAVGRRVTNFIFPDMQENAVGLKDFRDCRELVRVFIKIHCPIANLHIKQVNELQQQYAKDGVQIIGIHSNYGVLRTQIVDHMKQNNITWTTLHDPD